MSELDEIKTILLEMRDNQREALSRQAEQLALAEQQLERSRSQVEESLKLQREAVAKQRVVMRIAVPGIALCIGLILYLMIRYL